MDPKPSKKMLTLPRFDSISDEWNESGNESWESGWMTVSAHHITLLTDFVFMSKTLLFV